ncbi:MAG: hypothetical protein HPZ79_08490 [Oscillospiraceae bacterium]|nr:hypothetical protein [Oscillospiraceae bacterium]
MDNTAVFQPSFPMRVLPYLIVGVLCLGACALEFFFATRKSKFPGLILPCIFIVFSIIVVLANLTWTAAPWQTGIDTVIFALICNIPTAITLIIYFICRNVQKRRQALEKMHIQDLE